MIRLNDVHSIPLIANMAQVDFVATRDVCIAHYNQKDKLTGGVLYSGGNKFSAEMHVASFVPNWSSKEMLFFTFFYAFKVRGWKKLFGRVPADNNKAMEFDIHLGFLVEAYLCDVYAPGKGLYILSMYEHQCKWHKMKPPKVQFPCPVQTSIVQPDPMMSYEVH